MRDVVAGIMIGLFAYGIASAARTPLDKPQPERTPATRNAVIVGQSLMIVGVLLLRLTQ